MSRSTLFYTPAMFLRFSVRRWRLLLWDLVRMFVFFALLCMAQQTMVVVVATITHRGCRKQERYDNLVLFVAGQCFPDASITVDGDAVDAEIGMRGRTEELRGASVSVFSAVPLTCFSCLQARLRIQRLLLLVLVLATWVVVRMTSILCRMKAMAYSALPLRRIAWR